MGTEDMTARIAGSMGSLGFDVSRVSFFEGYFNDSLTPSLPRAFGLRTAMYVDVDVDHISGVGFFVRAGVDGAWDGGWVR